MNTKRLLGLVVFAAFAVMMSACNLPSNAPTVIPGLDQTSIAQTVVVLQTQLVVQQPTTEIQPTATLSPTITTAPAIIPTAIPVVTQAPTYKAGPLTDVTYVDDSVVQPGAAFVKTWRIQNSGTGTWTSAFKIVFVNGNAMGGPASQTLGKSVAPGDSIDVSLSLIAPVTPGAQRGNWMLETDTGKRFGLGVNADSPFWVQVVVKKVFAVTNAVPNGPATWSGTCPGSLPLTANITSDAAGTVTYYYVINSVNTPSLSTTFSAAGTNTTPAYDFSVTASDSLVIKVYIDTPNHQLFNGSITIPVTCSP